MIYKNYTILGVNPPIVSGEPHGLCVMCAYIGGFVVHKPLTNYSTTSVKRHYPLQGSTMKHDRSWFWKLERRLLDNMGTMAGIRTLMSFVKTVIAFMVLNEVYGGL